MSETTNTINARVPILKLFKKSIERFLALWLVHYAVCLFTHRFCPYHIILLDDSGTQEQTTCLQSESNSRPLNCKSYALLLPPQNTMMFISQSASQPVQYNTNLLFLLLVNFTVQSILFHLFFSLQRLTTQALLHTSTNNTMTACS